MSSKKPQRIILTGFMGTGKSVVGRHVAEQLDWPFVDLDELIKAHFRQSISEIFAKVGQPAFREQEKRLLEESLKKEPVVLSTGGGAILDPESRHLMLTSGQLFALVAAPEIIYQRLQEDSSRPLLQVEDPLAEICRLLKERQPFYEEAHHVITTDQQTPEQIAQQIITEAGY